jgi:integrase
MKLTAAIVNKLTAPAGEDRIAWDDDLPGFGVRCRNGHKGYVCQYRVDGGQRRATLGDVRKITLENARKAARLHFAQVAMGRDPRAQKKGGADTTLTLARVADRYLAARKDVVRPATHKAAVHYFAVQWKPLRDYSIGNITRAMVASRLQEIIAEHGRVSAARARAYLSALYGWAAREGLCDTNVAATTNNPAAGLPARDRVLSAGEIKIIWDACADDDPGRIVKLLLLTACRRDEIARLSWSEVDLDRGQITIAAARSKNRKAHTVTLSAPALDLLRAVPRRPDTDFVFGGEHGFSGWSHASKALRSRMSAPVSHVLHDLRRSAATHMAELGVLPHIIETVLNHSSGHKAGPAGIYNLSQYPRETAAAWALWGERVLDIVEGREPKVVPLRTA